MSLLNVEDLLAERGIDISHETVRFLWNRFGSILGAEIRKRRVAHMGCLVPAFNGAFLSSDSKDAPWDRFGAPLRQRRSVGLDEKRGFACGGLIATQNHVNVERIELDAAADATGLVGCDEGRAGAEERVEHDVAPIGEVQQSRPRAWRSA